MSTGRLAGKVALITGAAQGQGAAAARALRPGARLIAPASTSLPGGVAELARDARHWVAECLTPPRLVSLARPTR